MEQNKEQININSGPEQTAQSQEHESKERAHEPEETKQSKDAEKLAQGPVKETGTRGPSRTDEPMEVDNVPYAMQIIIDELQNEDVQLRLNTIRRLHLIAMSLGPIRTRDELIPFITGILTLHQYSNLETIYDEDEVSMALLDQMVKFTQYIGGAQYLHHLLPLLTKLATVEEGKVRDRAVDVMRALIPLNSDETLNAHFIPVVLRLFEGDWFTSKSAGCGLVDAVYSRASVERKSELRTAFAKACADDTPLVRRAATSRLGEYAKVLEPEYKQEIKELFKRLALDNQDSVRLSTMDSTPTLLSLFKNDSEMQEVIRLTKGLIEDKSWRVRIKAAENIPKIIEVVGEQITAIEITNWYAGLLKDSEPEVRDMATKMLTDKLMPIIKDLPLDASQHVKITLANDIMRLSTLISQTNTVTHLFPIFLQLLRDETPEVRLGIISSLDNISRFIGRDELTNSVLPAIVELCQDAKWRVRLAIVEYIPLLATELGQTFFDDKLLRLSLTWLDDQVYAIRQAACIVMKKLTEKFGTQWTVTQVLPKVKELADHKNYLRRLTCIFCINELATVFDKNTTLAECIPVLNKMLDDPIPNVRFNIAKSYAEIGQRLDQEQRREIITNLDKLITDVDKDVCFFSQEAKNALSR